LAEIKIEINMGILSKLFGRKNINVIKRENHVDVFRLPNDDERMNWGMEKAMLTLHYFERCLKDPKPEQSYFSIKVKIDDGFYVEHIWLDNPHFDDEGNLFGVIGNKPVNVTSVEENQKIGISKDLISDWMIIENDSLIGGYTIRAIRDGLGRKEQIEFDKTNGLVIDDGVDYFEHTLETPEGALLCLEDAYDEKNIDKAITIMDFVEDAKLMLEKLNMPFDKEVVNTTAEALQLAYVKSIQENIPNFSNVKRAFPYREKIREDLYIITEICTYPNGGKSVQKIQVHNSGNGWKVLSPIGR
jgi:uncharacterized protein YegJ (DUF2314 family)